MCDVCDDMKRTGLPSTPKNFDDVAERLGHGRPNGTTSGTNDVWKHRHAVKYVPPVDPDALKDANEEATAQYLARTKHGVGDANDGLKYQLQSMERQLARMVAEGAPVSEVQRKNEMIEATGEKILRVLKRSLALAGKRSGGPKGVMDAVMRGAIEKVAKDLGVDIGELRVERIDFDGKK